MITVRTAKAFVVLAAVAGLSAACSTPAAPTATAPVAAPTRTYAAPVSYCAPLAKLLALGPVDYLVGPTLTADQARYAEQAVLVAAAAHADGRADVSALYRLDGVRLRTPALSDAAQDAQATSQTDLIAAAMPTVRADCELDLAGQGD